MPTNPKAASTMKCSAMAEGAEPLQGFGMLGMATVDELDRNEKIEVSARDDRQVAGRSTRCWRLEGLTNGSGSERVTGTLDLCLDSKTGIALYEKSTTSRNGTTGSTQMQVTELGKPTRADFVLPA